MDEQQRVFVTIDQKHPDVALIMVGTCDHNGRIIDDAYLVEVTTPAAANIVGRSLPTSAGSSLCRAVSTAQSASGNRAVIG